MSRKENQPGNSLCHSDAWHEINKNIQEKKSENKSAAGEKIQVNYPQHMYLNIMRNYGARDGDGIISPVTCVFGYYGPQSANKQME